MSYCNLTDNRGNTYLLSAGHSLQPQDPSEYYEATEALERIDSHQLFRAELEIFHFHNFELHERLERRLGPNWRHAHEVVTGLCIQAGVLPGRWPLILDAIHHGDLRFTKIASAPEGEATPEEDNRGILRVKIRQALAAIVTLERAEAAHHAKLLGEETRTNRAAIYTGAFLTGLWNAGADLTQWLKEVNDVINPLQRSLRGIHASYRALQRNSENGEDLLTAYRDEVLTAEKCELAQVLGFDPTAITREQFHQATELADLIWEDPALQSELRRFVKDYVKAQHAIEITEFSGAAAFEVLFTILLAAVTAGAGLAASAASQARHFAKFRKVGELLVEFGERVRKVRQRLRRNSTKGNDGSSRSFDEFPVDEVIVSTEEMPHKKARNQRGSNPQSGLKSPKESLSELSGKEVEQVNNVSTFITRGVTKSEAEDWLLNHPDGNSYYNDLRSSVPPSVPDEQVFSWATDHVKSGANLPRKINVDEPLVKIIPEGANIEDSKYSPFLTTRDQLDIAESSGKSKWDSFGLPMKNDSYSYSVYELPPKEGATGYISTIAPTEELSGKFATKAGLKQILVPSKENFGEFTPAGTIRG